MAEEIPTYKILEEFVARTKDNISIVFFCGSINLLYKLKVEREN